VVVGLIFAALLLALGVGAGARQFATLRRVREEPYLPDVDRVYLRGQARRRLFASGLLIAIGLLIAVYYVSGMDARMDELGAKPRQGEPPQEDKEFARFVGGYWVVVILLVGLVGLVAVLDFWATRVYWMARYKEMKSDHETKLQRDLAVYRQQRLNNRVKGLKKPDDETNPDGEPPVE
jgi:hypothetical protein